MMYLDMSNTLLFFFFNDTATTEIYTLSLHDALPICRGDAPRPVRRNTAARTWRRCRPPRLGAPGADRKSTRLNSSHMSISYAVFCLKKKTNQENLTHTMLSSKYKIR